MALTKEQLVNVVIFMERASKSLAGSGEHRAFAQTYEAVHAEIEKLDKRAAKKQGESK